MKAADIRDEFGHREDEFARAAVLTACPFTFSQSLRSEASIASLVTTNGPIGAKPSQLLPLVNWRRARLESAFRVVVEQNEAATCESAWRSST